ncbi:MAG: hypothetical protein COT26_02730 [Candidatus Kerfeldbacteria bacterium CG08_land_8_20_14_0_20_43_14]|uniref:Haloacid dehalogenase n=1 Tax=Candidatus Kerfeldbacteria bacterium CG08_land_8_20_14_0_20_43_14 TaxID=2014246 RepID=A0A2H0YPV8_9BACT|nr:MAG: hypothetical protein COT26_02730 [Candidatus Kerfeldbacteria bacterium CG08_land_8_20_14_0_20_43_14]
MSLFKSLKKCLQKQKAFREKVIVESRKALQNSKLAIFALHRNEEKQAKKLLAEAEDILKEVLKEIQGEPKFLNDGNILAALEEFGEAWLVLEFNKSGELKFPKHPELPPDQKVGALTDFTGEMVRAAVLQATNRNYKAVDAIYEVVESVVHNLADADLTGQGRQKFDDAKRNLKRLEEIRYDLSLRIPRA